MMKRKAAVGMAMSLVILSGNLLYGMGARRSDVSQTQDPSSGADEDMQASSSMVSTGATLGAQQGAAGSIDEQGVATPYSTNGASGTPRPGRGGSYLGGSPEGSDVAPVPQSRSGSPTGPGSGTDMGIGTRPQSGTDSGIGTGLGSGTDSGIGVRSQPGSSTGSTSGSRMMRPLGTERGTGTSTPGSGAPGSGTSGPGSGTGGTGTGGSSGSGSGGSGSGGSGSGGGSGGGG